MRLKQIVVLLIAAVLVFGSLPSASLAKEDSSSGEYSTKDETIYGNLAKDGDVKDMYVVNTFHIKEPGEIVDHGDYADIRNLTNLSDMELNDNNVHFQAKKGDDDFNYQGFLENKPLPWNIDITYKLDGQKMDPQELAGKDGSLQIQIETSKNDANADKTFFEHYMLQLTLTLDPQSFDNIQAPDGTKAKKGKDTNVTFTGMPDEKGEFIVSAEVTDLEMDPIEISATPASMPIEDPDLSDVKGDMQSLADAVGDINDGVSDLKGGISDLNDGASDLNQGSNSYLNGINELNQSSSELVNGSSEINGVFQKVSDAVQKVPDETPDIDLGAFPKQIRSLADGLNKTADEIDKLRDNYDQAKNKLFQAIEGIADTELSQEQIEKLKKQIQNLQDSDVDQAVIDQLIESYHSAQKVKDVYNKVKAPLNAITDRLTKTSDSIRQMGNDASAFANKIENEMDNMDQLKQLDDMKSGLTDLASQYQSFHQGLVEYTDGVGNLAAKYQDIDQGIGDLSDGTLSLKGGASDLQEGTQELKEKTSDIPDEMQSEVDKMLEEYDNSDFEPTSFVSDKNEDVDVVQFALKTEPIEVEEDDTTDDTEEKEDKSIWQRFLDLFR